jgi:D-alanyl-D-alanine carboxypeptidase
VDNAGLPQAPEELSISSEKLSEFSSAPVRDIPEAVRELPNRKTQKRSKRSFTLWGLAGMGFVLAIALPVVWMQIQSFGSSSVDVVEASEPVIAESVATTTTASSSSEGTESSDQLLNHFPYEEAPASELEPVSPDGGIALRRTAAEKFLEMVDAARADGVRIMPLSGFRSLDEQESVFFDVKAERGQQATIRAEVSAPPGYSEHHTGYAIDVGDGYFPDADLRVSFEKTRAFEWLQENAAYYSFELSFPEDNPQGVSYEPWHWRFVGDRHSLETFYRARTPSSDPANSAESANPANSANPSADTPQSDEPNNP